MAVADVDLGRIRQERMRTNTFGDNARGAADGAAVPHRRIRLRRARRSLSSCAATVERFPYVPSDPAMLRENCYEAYNIQVQGLAQRLAGDRVEEAGHRRFRRARTRPRH